jgi:hypothetical protein
LVFRTPLPAWPDQFPGGGMSGCFHPVCCIHTPMVVANNAMVNTFLYLPDTVTCISEIPATNAKTQQAGSDLKPTPAFRSWRPHPLAGRTSATGPRSCKSLSPERLSCSRCSPHPTPIQFGFASAWRCTLLVPRRVACVRKAICPVSMASFGLACRFGPPWFRRMAYEILTTQGGVPPASRAPANGHSCLASLVLRSWLRPGLLMLA